jgi:hypothetical protein
MTVCLNLARMALDAITIALQGNTSGLKATREMVCAWDSVSPRLCGVLLNH